MFLLLTASSSHYPCYQAPLASCEWVEALPRRVNSLFRMLGDRSVGRSDQISPLDAILQAAEIGTPRAVMSSISVWRHSAGFLTSTAHLLVIFPGHTYVQEEYMFSNQQS